MLPCWLCRLWKSSTINATPIYFAPDLALRLSVAILAVSIISFFHIVMKFAKRASFFWPQNSSHIPLLHIIHGLDQAFMQRGWWCGRTHCGVFWLLPSGCSNCPQLPFFIHKRVIVVCALLCGIAIIHAFLDAWVIPQDFSIFDNHHGSLNNYVSRHRIYLWNKSWREPSPIEVTLFYVARIVQCAPHLPVWASSCSPWSVIGSVGGKGMWRANCR